MGFVFASIAVWGICKQFLQDQNSGHVPTTGLEEKLLHAPVVEQFDKVSGPEYQRQDGLRHSRCGYISYLLFQLGSTTFVVSLVALCADAYEEIIFSDNEYNARARSFILWWHGGLIWFLCYRACYDKVRNFFRLRCELPDAHYVLITELNSRDDRFSSSDDISLFMVRLRQAFASCRSQHVQSTLLVERLENVRDGGHSIPFITHRLQRLVLLNGAQSFSKQEVDLPKTARDLQTLRNGLNTEQVEMRLSRVGRNEVCVPIPSIFDALIQEFFQFFYIYQFFIISCYFFDDYISVGTVVLVILLLGGLRQAYLKRTAQIEVKSMVLDESKSDVLRNGIWIKIPSCDLVPGDVVRVRAGKVPCDLAILEGSAVVDEAMLTGESMPVAKVALEKNSNNSFDPDLHKKHALYAGTTILGQDSDSDSKCELLNLGICIRTGVNTSKGSLLCAILSPSNIRLKIDDHLSFALIILFGFAGVLFFVCIFAIFGAKDIYSWFYGIYQIVAVIPILLPSVFLASASSTVSALQKQNIFCTDPSRLMVCGKMRVWCFDKTGTLTKQGLDFVGAMPIKNSFFKSKTTVLEAGDIFTQVMASTHSLSRSEGRLVGTAVDCKMFEGTGWKLGPGPAPIDNKDLNENNWVHEPISGMRLHILKRFDFDHALMTMTVVVANYESNSVWSFTKGAYERISQLCLPASVPLDYTRVTQSLAADGCYVLAAGFRLLGNSLSDFDPVLSKREDLEQSLTCLGLIAFRNELKPTSASALAALRDGDIRSVIVTGDNEFTALYIAEQSGLIGPDAKLYVARGENENKVVWTDENGNAIAEPSIDSETSTHTEIVLTASAFRILERAGELDRILYYVRVFARMKPFDKVACVEMFMKQSIVGMCGDGGNDCGALRAAHAGVALSDAEAAVVSPFSSKNHSIWVVVDLIRHGRATLANSFASYKAMVMLGQICAWCQVVLYSYPVISSTPTLLLVKCIPRLIDSLID